MAPVEPIRRPEAALLDLVEAAHLATGDQLSALARDTARQLGADDATIYLVSRDETMLVPLPLGAVSDQAAPAAFPVDGTLAGRAYQIIEPQVSDSDDRRLFWVPLLDGVARLGVLCIAGRIEVLDDPEFDVRARRLASLLAEMVMTKRVYGDTIEKTVRTQQMSLAAELAWRLLPPLTFGTERLVISGSLQPAYDVGGDAFDYAVDDGIAHVAIFDAMGHGLQAGLLASVALAAYRNARRADVPLIEIVRRIDAAVADAFGGDRFATGIVGTLDLGTGVFTRVRAGHPRPLLLREHRVVKTLQCPSTLPFGVGVLDVGVCEEQLEPGDRVLLYTDGVTEARSADGEFFGVERLGDFAGRESASGAAAPEMLRRLTQSVLTHQQGQLQDDATLLLIEWRTGDELRFEL